MRRREFLALTAAQALAFQTSQASAATYPTRPIRLIVPFAPGGGVDAMARIISQKLSENLGQPVVVDNKAGAGGAIGALEMVRAAPDGYTLMMVSLSITAALPALNPNVGYNPVTDLTAIINVAGSAPVIAVHPNFPARNYEQFIAELKRKPDQYSYGSPGLGGIAHLQMELFKSLTGTSILHVPFKGAGPALTAVISGQVDMIRDALPSALPFIKDGRLIPIALIANARVKELPDVPTFKDLGIPQLSGLDPYGIVGPKQLPRDVVDTINRAAKAALADPGVRKNIDASGSMVIGDSPEEFSIQIKSAYEHLRKVVVDRQLKVE